MNKVSPQSIINDSELIINGSCRICLQEDNRLIRPCECTGTIQFVHEQCLRLWILSKIKLSLKSQSQYCQICKCQIHFICNQFRELNCKSASCNNIGCCYLCGFLIEIITHIILSILLHFNDSFFKNKISQVILIVCIILVSFSIIITIICMVYISSTVRKYQITKIYQRQQWKDRQKQNQKSRSFIKIKSNMLRRIQQNSQFQSRPYSRRIFTPNN